MIYTACKYFLWFILYSFGGWAMETLLYLFRDKKVVKRGFLFGPLCPIYGFGACLCTALLYGRIKNVFLVFLVGTLLTSTLEYVTHFAMEKLFHAMWWDYSGRRFNLKGRIYLKGSILFGLGVVVIIELIQPLFEKLVALIPHHVLYIICFALYSVLIVDVAIMVSDLRGTANALKKIQSQLFGATQKGVDLTSEQIDSAREKIKESDFVKKANSLAKDNTIIERFNKKYPNFTFKNYKYIMDIINDPVREDKARKDIKLYGTAETLPKGEEKE